MTIVGIDDNAQGTNQSAQPLAGNRYVAVRVTLENAATSEITAPVIGRCHTSDGTEFGRSFVAVIGQGLSVSIAPGGKPRELSSSMVPIGAKIQWIK